MAKQLSKEEFIELIAEKQLGIQLDEIQRRFLDLIKERGVCLHMTKEGRASPEYQELTKLLETLHKDGVIPSFQIVDK